MVKFFHSKPTTDQVVRDALSHLQYSNGEVTPRSFSQARETLFRFADPDAPVEQFTSALKSVFEVRGLSSQQTSFLRICFGLESSSIPEPCRLRVSLRPSLRENGERVRRVAKQKAEESFRLAGAYLRSASPENHASAVMSYRQDAKKYAAVAYSEHSDQFRLFHEKCFKGLVFSGGVTEEIDKADSSWIEVIESSSVSEPSKKLRDLIGLVDVKESVKFVTNLVTVSRQESCSEDPLEELRYPLTYGFFGNPGTGKTTVASLFGALLKETGFLKSGHVVVVSRATIFAGGPERVSLNTQKVLDRSKDGVLFLDNADQLSRQYGSGTQDGEEAILTILLEMRRYPSSRAVIFSSYLEKKEDFFSIDSRLCRQVQFQIEFPDYADIELSEILQSMSKARGFSISEKSAGIVASRIGNRRGQKTFGNAGDVENALIRAMSHRAGRVMSSSGQCGQEIDNCGPQELILDDFVM